jgi:hypothetical protein
MKLPCECPLPEAAYQVHCPHHGISTAVGFDASWVESAGFVARILLHVLLGGRLRIWYATREPNKRTVLFEPRSGA